MLRRPSAYGLPDVSENGILEVLEGSQKINISDKFLPL